MRKSILTAVLVVTLAVITFTARGSSAQLGETFGFSSDDSGGSSYLGVDTRNVTTDRMADLKLKEERGVEITMVDQDAPAGKAGLKEHDVILTVNGTQVESVEQLRRMIHEIPPGRMVTLGISRDGQPMTIKAQLASRKSAFALANDGKAFKFAMPAMPLMPAIPALPDMDIPVSVVVVHSSARSGLMVENLTPQLADFFGAKQGKGILVRSVDKGSRAEKAGFRAGDVIVRVDGESIDDTSDFTHALHNRKDNKDNTVSIGIIRDKKEQTVTLTLPEHKQSEVIDETLEVPEIDAETRIDLREAADEIARIKPELERSAEELGRFKTAEIERLGPEIEQSTRELREHKEELKKEIQELQREFCNSSSEI
jgi:serine protease Do